MTPTTLPTTMSNTEKAIRFFAALLIALVPMLLVGSIAALGLPVSHSNAGWSIMCSILLIGYISYRVLSGFRLKP